MANELVHTSAGTTLTQAEFEAVGLHVCNSQATGDLIYASSSTQLTRLAKGAANTVLVMGASIPAWSATLAGLTLTSPTINGTIATTGLTLPAVTLGGNMTVTGYAFDAGAGNAQINTTGSWSGLNIVKTSDDETGAAIFLKTVSANPAVSDALGIIFAQGYDSNNDPKNYGNLNFRIENVTAGGTQAGKFTIVLLNANSDNEALTLSGAGGLAVDLDNGGTDYYVSLFDEYDDALVLRQGIQQNNRELLANMGVLERKDTGSGYMMKIQPMVRLLAGGIYQSRVMIDEFHERLELAESKLKLLGAG